jgi:uncharacterized membrane protein YhaH (DUF805 family)
MTETFQTPPPLTPNYATLSTTEDKIWSSKGRFGRLSYLAWNMVIGLIVVIIVAMLGVVGAIIGITPPHGIGALTTIGLLLIIPLVYFVVVFQIRRLHDINRTGWWLTLPFIDNIIVSTISKFSHDANVNILLSGIVVIINIIFMFYLMIAKGTDGINNYGDQRTTPQWEKTLGWIYIIFIPLILIGGTLIAYNGYKQRVAAIQQSHVNYEPSIAEPAALSPMTSTAQ